MREAIGRFADDDRILPSTRTLRSSEDCAESKRLVGIDASARSTGAHQRVERQGIDGGHAMQSARAAASGAPLLGMTAHHCLRLPSRFVGCGSFMACVLAGCRGEAWLKKGLLSSK